MGTVNDDWNKLFGKYDILAHVNSEGAFRITANQIRELHEPRLMAKFDWADGMPEIFKDNNLSILPISRGTYLIGKFKAYHKLKVENIKPEPVRLPDWVRTWDNLEITSESVALNVAKATGMIDTIMKSDENFPSIDTITGRLKSGNLNYQIQLQDKHKGLYDISVKNAQVEIDAGFENIDNLALVEAKTHIPEDFMIRQLYYPYRIYNALGTGKEVLPFYFTYADEIFNFYQYRFENLNNYSSIKLVKQFSFILDQTLNLNVDVVKEISANSPMNPETSGYPYPQANTFQMVLDTIKYLETPKDAQELADKLSMDKRQGHYYVDCLGFLGLAQRINGKFSLTQLGRKVNALPNSNARNEIIIQQMLSHITLKLIFDSYLRNNGKPDNDYIDRVIDENVEEISGSTVPRRRGTIKQWIKWIFSVIE